MKGYADVQKAFQDAFTAEIQGKTYSADKVIAADSQRLFDIVAGPLLHLLRFSGSAAFMA